MKLIDRTGQRYGALTVIAKSETRKYGRVSWLCRCDCGREIIVDGANLAAGRYTSCGCNRGRAEKRRHPDPDHRRDLTGQTFGELTALVYVGRNRWLWRCSCGRETTVKAADVLNGTVTSCGHVLRETARRKIKDQNLMGFEDGTCMSIIQSISEGKVRSTNTSGATGVTARRLADGSTAYRARITFQGREHNLGTYSTFEAAVEARKKAEHDFFGSALEGSEWTKRKSNT